MHQSGELVEELEKIGIKSALLAQAEDKKEWRNKSKSWNKILKLVLVKRQNASIRRFKFPAGNWTN